MSSQRAGGARPDDGAGSNPAGGEALGARLRETAALLSVARVASSTTDFQEALRLICRELARVTGAETVSARVPPVQKGPRAKGLRSYVSLSLVLGAPRLEDADQPTRIEGDPRATGLT